MGFYDESNENFYESLEQGELVFASNHRTELIHVIRLGTWAGESRGAKEDVDYSPDTWSARAICGVEGSGYFWTARLPGDTKVLDDDLYCGRCLNKWESWDCPPIRGFNDYEEDEDYYDLDIYVSAGWREVDPIGHPEDEDFEYNDDPSPRRELRRWRRGRRYVRLLEIEEHPRDYPYAVHYGNTEDLDSDNWKKTGGLEECAECLETLMRIGGYPKRSRSNLR